MRDLLTGLVWSRNANPADFPLTWQEGLDFVGELNRDHWQGHADWRLPNRSELRSLVSFQTRRPSLVENHPFSDVFPGWYWSSTSLAAAPDHAWYVNMDGARTFFGGKDQSFFVWPVRETSDVLARTGQIHCYGTDGSFRPCPASGEDGAYLQGNRWPCPRLTTAQDGVFDRLTGLIWHPCSDSTASPVTWKEALAIVASRGNSWRLPNINELDSLVDCSQFDPALPKDHAFGPVYEGYWSSTTSLFAPDWAWALYSKHGGIGVGQKKGRHFYVWAVRDASASLNQRFSRPWQGS